MRNSVYLLVLILVSVFGCNTAKSNFPITEKTVGVQGDTVRIANDDLEYEVIIIDPGFNIWLNSRALQRGYHSQFFLAAKNQLYITEWNSRVLQPRRYDPNLYEMTINYNPTIDYGYEVNYLIYNYMIYFQNTYNQQLFGYVPVR